jgi:hypothetical protein
MCIRKRSKRRRRNSGEGKTMGWLVSRRRRMKNGRYRKRREIGSGVMRESKIRIMRRINIDEKRGEAEGGVGEDEKQE